MKPLRFNNGLFKCPRRTLHHMLPCSKVLFISHAGIYALHWALKTSPHSHKYNIDDLVIFYREPWFYNVHPEHNKNEWGQSLNEFPSHVVNKFRKCLHKEYKESDLLTFEQVKMMHKSAVDEIKEIFTGKSFIKIENDFSPIVTSSESGYSINYGNGKHQTVGKDTFFYNWFKTPINHKFEQITKRSVAELYREPKSFFKANSIKSVIIYGASPTIDWIIRDFDEVKEIGIIKRKGSNPQVLPRNKKYRDIITSKKILTIFEFLDDGTILYEGNPCELSIDENSGGKIASIRPTQNNIDPIIGHFYTGMGLTPESSITKGVSIEKKLDVPSREKNKFSPLFWVAPKNTPSGSMTQSFLRWMSETDNIMYCHEPQFYHKQDFRRVFSQHFENCSTMDMGSIKNCGNFNEKFYSSVDQIIESMDSPKTFNELCSMLDEQLQLNFRENIINYARIK